MLFRVSGKFADKHTFSINPVDGADAKDALATVIALPEVTGYGSPVVAVTVKALGGAAKKIRISEKPAAERKASTAAAPAAPAPSRAPTRRK